MRTLKLLLIISLTALTVNCNGIRRQFHYFMDMAYSPSVDTQQIDDIGNRIGNRLPPENTIPYKFLNKQYNKTIPGHYVTSGEYQSITYKIDGVEYGNVLDDHAAAAKLIKTPLTDDAATLERGADRYRIYCSPCHGISGQGDGPVKAKWQGVPIPAIARVNSGEAVPADDWSRERLFMLITTGKGSMQTYAPQIPEIDRWAIAHHIKKLQAEAKK